MKSYRHTAQGTLALGAAIACAFVAAPAGAQWVQFANETNTRVSASSSLVVSDGEEKSYSWGDVNKNGWLDLVIGRKQPFSTSGRRVNVLLMNQNGVLVDQTVQYATAADVAGDEGFLTPTADRGVKLVDVNGNDWLDLATGTAYGSGLPKAISHPRVYRNLGNDGGSWQGFLYEESRVPELDQAPNTCGVSAGDVTGNGVPDLYYPTYNSTFNDFLLINDGNGFFTDETDARVPASFHVSGFGTSSHIVDLNGNGFADIIKSEAGPVKVAYNDGNGFFINNHTPSSGSHYHVTIGDLNKNGRIDMVIVDDGTDIVRLNQGNNAQGQVIWSDGIALPNSGGFGGNVYTVDLNNNTWLDIIVADVDIDIPGCDRSTNIYRSNQNAGSIGFIYDIANIPNSMLTGTHDVASFDINSDGWIDLVIGRCNSTQVWINQPPFNLSFDYPDGLPALLEPEEPTVITAEIVAVGGELSNPNLHVSVNDGPFSATPMSSGGDGTYSAAIPASECGDTVRYYITAEISGTEFADPPNAPQSAYEATAVEDIVLVSFDDFDASDGNFSVENDPTHEQGAWVHAEPTGALAGPTTVAPFGDAGGNGMAFVTCPGCTGLGCASTCNVNAGPTHLLSETINLGGAADAVITYDRWMFCNHAGVEGREDFLSTWISNDGGSTWTFVHETGGTNNNWQSAAFLVSDYVTPTANVVVRFTVDDSENSSITNAGIDNFTVEELDCGFEPAPCTGDLTGDGVVNVFDLLDLLGAWGENPGHAGDINGDGVVNVFDLLDLLGAWGNCP